MRLNTKAAYKENMVHETQMAAIRSEHARLSVVMTSMCFAFVVYTILLLFFSLSLLISIASMLLAIFYNVELLLAFRSYSTVLIILQFTSSERFSIAQETSLEASCIRLSFLY